MPIYDRSDVNFNADDVPALFYSSGREDNGVTTDGVSPNATGGIPPVAPRVGDRRTMTLSWRMPLRRSKYYTMDVRLELRGMGYGDVMKLPVRFYFGAGGETR